MLIYNGEGQAGEPFLAGLIDVEALAQAPALEAPATTGTYPPSEASYPGRFRPDPASIPWGITVSKSAPVLDETAKTAPAPEDTHRREDTQKDRIVPIGERRALLQALDAEPEEDQD
jgi:hypothetical protein